MTDPAQMTAEGGGQDGPSDPGLPPAHGGAADEEAKHDTEAGVDLDVARPVEHEGSPRPTDPFDASAAASSDRRSTTASTTQMRVHLAEHHDALTGELVLRHVPGRRVVDLGVGSPAISEWVARRAARIASVPLATIETHAAAALAVASAAGDAAARDSSARRAALPLHGESFDVALILHTLPHLGEDAASSTATARWLLAEAARMLRPGGVALVDIANPRSLGGLVAGVLNPATAIRQVPGGTLVIGPSAGHSRRRASAAGGRALHHGHDRERITRYDTLAQLHRLVPASLEDVEVHGIGVFAPRARVLSLPLVGGLLRRLDWFARDGLFLRYFGARLLIVLRKLPAARRRTER